MERYETVLPEAVRAVRSRGAAHPGVARQWRYTEGRYGDLLPAKGRDEAPRDEAPREKGLSVAVCTYKRARSVGGFLDALAEQTRPPEALLVVDASPDEETEQVLRAFIEEARPTCDVEYLRVEGALRGLINQRNLALWLTRERILCFFDDDVTLGAPALEQIEAAFEDDAQLVGVGGADQRNSRGMARLPRRWRVRSALGLWQTSEIGRLGEAGVAIPWSLAVPFAGRREVDVLSGYAMCWRMDKLRGVFFDEELQGPTANGEEIEFSLRTRPLGKKVLLGDLPIQHHHDPEGRVPSYEKAQEAGRNQPRIYARHGRHSARSLAKFVLWQVVDVGRSVAAGLREPARLKEAFGRCAGLVSFLVARLKAEGRR